MHHADVVIAGAGLIGATLALELAQRGLHIALVSEGEPLEQASTAAAGMLAVDDPENPIALHPLARLSRALYPYILQRLAEVPGCTEPVRFQTDRTLQAVPSQHTASHPLLTGADLQSFLPGLVTHELGYMLLDEASLDPRELATAIRAALAHSPRIQVHTHARILQVTEEGTSVTARTATLTIAGSHFADCGGAWPSVSNLGAASPVHPRKGQILSVALPPGLSLPFVVRTPGIYIVPRLHGPRAGHAVIGATVEDRGFDTTVEPHAIAALHAKAAALLPALASAPIVQTWAGLRPTTADLLPILGRTSERTSISKGHFRNGILLAPGSAAVLADLITGHKPAIDLAPFSPGRALSPPASAGHASNHAAETATLQDPHDV